MGNRTGDGEGLVIVGIAVNTLAVIFAVYAEPISHTVPRLNGAPPF